MPLMLQERLVADAPAELIAVLNRCIAECEGECRVTVMNWILSVVGIAGAIVIAFVAWLWLSAKAIRCKGGAVQYASTVTAEEARRLGAYLESRDFFSPTQTIIGLQKEKDTYQFQLAVAEDEYQDQEVLVKIAVIAAALSEEVFDLAPVEGHLCDGLWLTRTVVPHSRRFGERFRFNAAELFATAGVTEDQAVRLGTYLMSKDFFNNNPKLGQLNRNAEGFELRLQVKNESDPVALQVFQQIASDLSHEVFGGVAVDLCMCEGARKTLQQQVPDPATLPIRGSKRVFSG